jgi:hypothetical protein
MIWPANSCASSATITNLRRLSAGFDRAHLSPWGVYVATILDAVLDVAENGLGIGDAIEKITVTMMGQFSETVHSFDGVIELIKKLLPPFLGMSS